MNHAQRPSVEEAIRIGKVSMEFVEAYDFIAEMRDAFQCRPINQPKPRTVRTEKYISLTAGGSAP